MIRIALLSLIALLVTPLANAQPAADLIVWNGPVYTGEPTAPRVEAIAARDGVIVYSGARPGAEALKGARTQVIDLRGASAFPGFTDAHAHLRGIGERELMLNLEGMPSIAALAAAVKARVDALPANGAVLVGRGWIETHWPERRFPTRTDLDAVSPDTAVILERADGHALVANSRALDMAGITDATQPPAGGAILRDAAGKPTGMLIDNAMALIMPVVARAARPTLAQSIDAAFRVYPARGWVGVHNMSVEWDEVLALESASRRRSIPLRLYNAVTPEAGARLFASGPRHSPDGRVVTRAIKYYADGALGSRGAALFSPYADAPESSGLILLEHDKALPVFERALRQGIQIATHGIGDRGNAMILDAYAEAFAHVPASQRAIAAPRWRIEHAQVLRREDIPRFRQLGVIASMQPSHAIGDLHFAPARLGGERLAGAYAWSSLEKAGVIVPGGSDAPVERGDPLIEFYAAIARKDLNGFSGDGWRPEEAVARETALAMFTVWPAHAAFENHLRGQLKAGQRADISVFSVDLMTAPAEEIPKGRALLTVIDGRTAWRAEGW
ncbi:MAG: amidohydrolase [Hyphomonadaceae bacterium]|nr:amidohydrolase [Hyphomonadaceae bacterium]